MKRILIIEGEEITRNFTRDLLAGEGYAVDIAQDGPTGMGLFQARWYDLVILDIFMPGLAGFDALLGIGPDHTGTPVIVLSGGRANTMLNRFSLAIKLGAARGFPKDYETDDFLAVVRELLGAGTAGPSAPGTPSA